MAMLDLFLTHAWRYHDDWQKLVDLLNTRGVRSWRRRHGKPIIAVPPSGTTVISDRVRDLSDTVVEWNADAIVEAVAKARKPVASGAAPGSRT